MTNPQRFARPLVVSLMLMAVLALPLASAAPPQAPHDEFFVYLPLITKPGMNIGGFVTDGGAPAGNAHIYLRQFTPPSSSFVVDDVYTDSAGRYDFTNEPTLPPGKLYWIMFGGSAPDRLLWWTPPKVDPNIDGLDVEIEPFDVAAITQTAPAFNELVTLPYTFEWTARPATPQDNYRITFSGSANFSITNLGHVGSYTLQSLPQGAPFGPNIGYYWTIYISWADGSSGAMYGDSRVYFNNAGVLTAPFGALRPNALSRLPAEP